MNVIRVRELNALRPLHVVLICLTTATVAGSCLLLSAAESKTLVDGAVEWQAESPLRAVVQLLCLDYQFPTLHAGEAKTYVLGIGTGLVMIALSVAVVFQGRAGEEDAVGGEASDSEPAGIVRGVQIAPLDAAQALLIFYLLWSFASARWSAAPELAVGGSILLSIHALWALGIGRGLNASAARITARAIVAVAGITAVVALWYYYGRNPTLRAKFPFGNPTFLSTALIPGILLSLTLACEKGILAFRVRSVRSLVTTAVALFVAGVCLWAFFLADSRGAQLGLVFGVLAVLFFGLRGRAKAIPIVGSLAILVWGFTFFVQSSAQPSPTGRDATIRVRMYAWDYAWQMFNEKPFTGHGQGGFVLLGDSYVVGDVLNDPKPFGTRIAHAHSEWLEVMADLGSVGLVLIVAVLLTTLRAGMTALKAPRGPGEYWVLLGLLGALVALIVEESTGVGLRVTGVGTLFYAVIGLIWALGGHRQVPLPARFVATPPRRTAVGMTAGLIGLAVLVATQHDFAAARAGFEVQEHLDRGEYEEATLLAGASQSRLNPQRALADLARQIEAHSSLAEMLRRRAADRQARAQAAARPDRQLRGLASQDFQASYEACIRGTEALRELVSWSPGYLNHGRLEYRLNLTLAQSPAVQERNQFLSAATAAIERELLRQPFATVIAMDFVKIADRSVEPARIVDVLARPLRYARISPGYVDLLGQLMSDPDFRRGFETMIEEARGTLTSADRGASGEGGGESWAPEMLRLGAAVHFMRGEYGQAASLLETASKAYEDLALRAPLGAASCYAELADCRFFHDPKNSQDAIASSVRARELAPQSLHGRRLKGTVRQRQVDYYIAAGREDEAISILKDTGPARVTNAAVLRQLGLRYRELCEALLQRREAQVLRQPPQGLLGNLLKWIHRSIELRPDDAAGHFVAADLTFHVEDDTAAATHLRSALEYGLPPDLVLQFLQVALAQKPNSIALVKLRRKLEAVDQPSDD